MANPYRGRDGGRIDSGEPRQTRTARRPAPTARPKGDSRPTNNGQPTYPVGMPPIQGGGGPPTRGIDQGLFGPLAPRPSGGGANPMPPSPTTGFGPGGPANWAQGGHGGSLADDIINDTAGGKKDDQKQGHR